MSGNIERKDRVYLAVRLKLDHGHRFVDVDTAIIELDPAVKRHDIEARRGPAHRCRIECTGGQ